MPCKIRPSWRVLTLAKIWRETTFTKELFPYLSSLRLRSLLLLGLHFWLGCVTAAVAGRCGKLSRQLGPGSRPMRSHYYRVVLQLRSAGSGSAQCNMSHGAGNSRDTLLSSLHNTDPTPNILLTLSIATQHTTIMTLIRHKSHLQHKMQPYFLDFIQRTY